MTFSIGEKVRINENYLKSVPEPDSTIKSMKGREGVVVAVSPEYIDVEPSAPDSEIWDIRFLFLAEELDKL